MNTLSTSIILVVVNVFISSLNCLYQKDESFFHHYSMFLPDHYNRDKKYPLLFMLHGHGGDQNQWNGIVDLKWYANKYGFIIVCPDGNYDSWYVNSPILKESQFENYFFKNLVPEIFSNYSIDSNNIFITGLSMGGHGAINLFLNHPYFFKSAGSTSGILDLIPFPDNWGIKNLLGDQETYRDNWVKHSAIYNLDKIRNFHKKLIVDCGTEDFAFDVNRRFRDSCAANGININFIQTSGNHSYDYWAKSIIEHFNFFKAMVEEQ